MEQLSLADELQEAVTPYVKILEQPAPTRFRYKSEGRLAGSILGANSTLENKTFPAVQVFNYVGKAMIVVSCVTALEPYKPHPHNLVGREGCRQGICTLEINTDDMRAVFSNLGIRCIRRKDLKEALRVREELRIDPFRTGFAHRNQPASFDLNAVRLCFQVFLEDSLSGKFTRPLTPVVSDIIINKKADLKIIRLSHCNASCTGGQEMILLCEKVEKEDIQIKFYEDVNGGWIGYGHFPISQVYKNTAICFQTPRFKSINFLEPVRVKIQLNRPSDNAVSEPLDFEMLPLNEENKHRPNYVATDCLPVTLAPSMQELPPFSEISEWSASPKVDHTQPLKNPAMSISIQRQSSSIFANFTNGTSSPTGSNPIWKQGTSSHGSSIACNYPPVPVNLHPRPIEFLTPVAQTNVDISDMPMSTSSCLIDFIERMDPNVDNAVLTLSAELREMSF